MLNLNELVNAAELVNRLHRENEGLVGVNGIVKPQVHLLMESFFDTFSSYKIEKLEPEEELNYPYRVSTEYLGVEFFALLTEKDYEECVDRRDKNAEEL